MKARLRPPPVSRRWALVLPGSSLCGSSTAVTARLTRSRSPAVYRPIHWPAPKTVEAQLSRDLVLQKCRPPAAAQGVRGPPGASDSPEGVRKSAAGQPAPDRCPARWESLGSGEYQPDPGFERGSRSSFTCFPFVWSWNILQKNAALAHQRGQRPGGKPMSLERSTWVEGVERKASMQRPVGALGCVIKVGDRVVGRGG